MKIAPHIIEILSSAEVDGKSLTLKGTLSRKDYVDANKVIEAIGGKWDRKARSHVFGEDVSEMIDNILLTGEYARTKQDLGQFDTPEELAMIAAERANLKEGDIVLEPNGGIGNLIEAAIQYNIGPIDTFEIDKKRVSAMHMRFSASDGVNVVAGDFLEAPVERKYDKILMNPPFANQADIDHVLHAAKMLKPGGRLVAIMSNSITFRSNIKTMKFMEFLTANDAKIDKIPEKAFASSGTNVNTVMVSFDIAA